MEIIKPGKIRKIKLKCGECGCEFTCHLGELIHRYGSVWAQCPQEGCHKSVEVPNGTPEYIAPAKQHHAVGTVAVELPMVIVRWGAPERFYIGSGGALIAYTPHTGKLYEQE